jgi:hypothetical protein
MIANARQKLGQRSLRVIDRSASTDPRMRWIARSL